VATESGKATSARTDSYIRFMGLVDPARTTKLFHVIDEKVAAGVQRLYLLLNTPGGNVAEGIAIYNYLRGAPIEVVTHNFGTVDSIGIVIFCAGKKRLSVPHARFLLHPVAWTISGSARFSEQNLEEELKGLRIDQENICRVIADTVGKRLEEVLDDVRNSKTLNPHDAKAYNLVDEIRSELHPAAVDLVVID
jgi:ATP-dependent Clp protease, protease subunit